MAPMILGELNGYTARLPSIDKARKRQAVTSAIQVVKYGVVVKQFRFRVADDVSRRRAIRKAKQFMTGASPNHTEEPK